MKDKPKAVTLRHTEEAENEYVETREDYLVKGRNGLESAVIISDQLGNVWGGKKLMEWEKVKFILRTLNENNIKYAIIGGIAMGQHALPRTTHDLDILVAVKDLGKVRKLFKKHYKGGTTVVQIYDIEGTRLDVLPGKLRHRVAALDDAIDSHLDEIPTKVVSVRDMLILKLLAVADRKDATKALQDRADAGQLLKYGKEFLSKEDIVYIAKNVLLFGYTEEDAQKYRALVQWVNDILAQLDMTDLIFPMD